jgi:cytidine deaminase
MMAEELKSLLETAKAVCEKAYVPYSKFPVGCVILSESGQIYTGCNVENISFGMTMCAERTAVFKAISNEGPALKIKQVVIYTPTEIPITPCGGCRQVLREFGDHIEIMSFCASDEVKSENIQFYLPDSPDIRI